MVLVVDAAKGIQAQTAECIVIGELAADDMVVALNKIGAWLGSRSPKVTLMPAVYQTKHPRHWTTYAPPLCTASADQFPEEKRERYCRKAAKLVGATLAATKFAGCPVVPVAARPGTR